MAHLCPVTEVKNTVTLKNALLIKNKHLGETVWLDFGYIYDIIGKYHILEIERMRMEVDCTELADIFREVKGWPKRTDVKKFARKHRIDLMCLEIAMQDYANGCFARSAYRSGTC